MNTKKMRLCERILNIILDILIFIFGIILLILIYNGIQKNVLKNKYSSFFGFSIFEVQTGSMADAINPGDWIVVKASKNIKLDDVITYQQDGKFITHRVIEMYSNTIVTKGDANPVKDKPIKDDQVVGKVVNTLPYFGIFRGTLFNPVVLVTLIITVYLFSFAFRKSKNDEGKAETKQEAITKLDKTVDSILGLIKNKIKANKEKANKEKAPKDTKKIIKEEIKPEKVEEKIVPEVTENKEDNDVAFEQVPSELPQQEETVETEMVNIEPVSEEDLDKTMYFRAIKVDRSELDETFLEIEKNREIEEAKEEKERLRLEKKKAKEQEKLKEEPEEIDESLIKEGLEMLQNKTKKKFKNVIDKVMYIKSCELNEIVSILNNKEKLLVNEASIKDSFIKSYIDVKYYNYCGDNNAEYTTRNMTVKIVDTIKEFSEKMVKSYKGPDKEYEDKVKKYTNIFILIMYLEQAKGKIDDIEPIREMYKKKITRYSANVNEKTIKEMISEIIKVQRLHDGMIKYTLKKLETNTFVVNYNQAIPKQKVYALELDHNIAFSKVYSDYIVDKTYSEGVIAEDKVMIMLSLASIKLVKDMLNSDFRNKYILYVPESLYAKESKFNKFLSMMEDEYLKNNIIILVKFEVLVSNIKKIKELRKSGYKFALVFDKTVELKDKDQKNLSIAEYIFADKKSVDTATILSKIPEDIAKNVVFEDIGKKVGNYGGE